MKPPSNSRQAALVKVQGHRSPLAQRVQSGPRGPMALKVPPAEEENPRVKCRDCGAFGHKAGNRRCPIRCGSVVLVSQPLRSKEEKENRSPGRPLRPQRPGPMSQTERDQAPHQATSQRAQEQQGKAPVPKPPKAQQRRGQPLNLSGSKSQACVPHFNRPRTTPESRRGSGQGPIGTVSGKPQPRQHLDSSRQRQMLPHSMWVSGSNPSLDPRQPSQNPPKKCRVHSNPPEQTKARPLSKASTEMQAPPKQEHLEPSMSWEAPGQLPSTHQQQLLSRAALISVRPCVDSPHQPSAEPHAAGALRMLFTRQEGDSWSCRFQPMTPELPMEKQTPSPESPAFLENSQGAHCSQVPVSVLYEDLWVSSSSSEDSDWD